MTMEVDTDLSNMFKYLKDSVVAWIVLACILLVFFIFLMSCTICNNRITREKS